MSGLTWNGKGNPNNAENWEPLEAVEAAEEIHDPETGTTRYLPTPERKILCKNCAKPLTLARGEWLHIGKNGYLHWNCEDESGHVADPNLVEPKPSPQAEAEGQLFLADRADGVTGHYCIGRREGAFSSYWNPSGWAGSGYLFTDKGLAESVLSLLSMQSHVSSPAEGVENAEEREMLKLIDERDLAEDAVGEIYSTVTGRQAEWSNLFGYTEAINEVEEVIADLSKKVAQSQPSSLAGTFEQMWAQNIHRIYSRYRGNDLDAFKALAEEFWNAAKQNSQPVIESQPAERPEKLVKDIEVHRLMKGHLSVCNCNLCLALHELQAYRKMFDGRE